MSAIPPDLIALACQGDPAALSTLIRELTPGVFGFARRMTRSEEEARDITQETFLRMLKSLDRYDPSYSFTTWVYRITRNLCIDRSRHQSRWRRWFRRDDDEETDPMETLPDPGESQLEGLLGRELQGALERGLEGLKPMYREVLVLFHFEGLSYQEIAQVLELPMGTVMNRIFRARQHLKEVLGERLLEG